MAIQGLISVLERLLEVQRAMNTLATEKTEVLKKNDIKGLEAIMKQEDAYVAQLEQLETQRVDETKGLLKAKGIMPEDVTLSAIVHMVAENEREQIETLQEQLQKEMDQLQSQNELNQDLIRQSLHFINLSIDMVAPPEPDVTYQKPSGQDSGYDNGPKRTSIFDSKA